MKGKCRENPLIERKADLEQQLAFLEKTQTDPIELLRTWVLQANLAEKWISSDNWVEMKSFLKNAGSNRLLQSQTLTVTFKQPWNLLTETTVSVRSTADISEQCSRWWRRGELNPCPQQTQRRLLHA
jgi:hypothetical protein